MNWNVSAWTPQWLWSEGLQGKAQGAERATCDTGICEV